MIDDIVKLANLYIGLKRNTVGIKEIETQTIQQRMKILRCLDYRIL